MTRGYPDFEGDKNGLYSRAEWASVVGEEKIIGGYSSGKTWGQLAETDYAVPSGKTLYIVSMGLRIAATGSADYDHHLYFAMYLSEIIGVTYVDRAVLGGLGGGFISFPVPIPIDGGNSVAVMVYNKANVSVDIDYRAYGYEV